MKQNKEVFCSNPFTIHSYCYEGCNAADVSPSTGICRYYNGPDPSDARPAPGTSVLAAVVENVVADSCAGCCKEKYGCVACCINELKKALKALKAEGKKGKP